mmetsp:Transcript_78554/g.163210  ORF Transcript_78554/g.163210 Transcript_78554/m.163210 type:complete len:432 (-) Transcript_78554:72-1367(-)
MMWTPRQILLHSCLVIAFFVNVDSVEAVSWHLPSFVGSSLHWRWPWRSASGSPRPQTETEARTGSGTVTEAGPVAAAVASAHTAAQPAARDPHSDFAPTSADDAQRKVTTMVSTRKRAKAAAAASSDVRLQRMEASIEKEESLLKNEDSLLTNLTKRHNFLSSRTRYLKERIQAQQLKLEIDRQLPGAHHAIHGLPAVVVDQGASFQLVASGDWASQVESNLRALTLAATIGLKGTLPVLTVEFGFLFVTDFPYQFSKDFTWMGSIPALCIMIFLVLVEIVADAIPVLDEFVDMVMAVLKPAVAALMTIAMQHENSTSIHLTVICGAIFLAAGVAAAKQASTMMLDVATGGSGAPFRSVFESVIAACLTLAGIYSDVAGCLIVVAFVSVSLAVCFSARGRDSPKSGPYLASLCLWPEPVAEAQPIKMPRIP